MKLRRLRCPGAAGLRASVRGHAMFTQCAHRRSGKRHFARPVPRRHASQVGAGSSEPAIPDVVREALLAQQRLQLRRRRRCSVLLRVGAGALVSASGDACSVSATAGRASEPENASDGMLARGSAACFPRGDADCIFVLLTSLSAWEGAGALLPSVTAFVGMFRSARRNLIIPFKSLVR